MTKNMQAITRRGLIGAGASLPILAASSRLNIANADGATGNQPHGGGYYRFTIGSLKAAIISDALGTEVE
jgi:hypothetical protein